MSRFSNISVAIVALIAGSMLGGLTVASAGGGQGIRLPLEFNARQFHGTLYVDESNGFSTLYFKSVDTGPGSPHITMLGPGCPGSPEFMAAQFNGKPSNWGGDYPRSYGWTFESTEPTRLNINFGSFWQVSETGYWDSSLPPDASAANPSIVTTHGVWQCYPPRNTPTPTATRFISRLSATPTPHVILFEAPKLQATTSPTTRTTD